MGRLEPGRAPAGVLDAGRGALRRTGARPVRPDRPALTRWRARAAEVAGIPNPFQARLTPLAAFVDARVAIHTGDRSDAPALVDRAQAGVPHGRYLPYARAAAAELAVVTGLPDATERLASAMPAGEQNDWAAACLARAAGRLHGDPGAVADSIARWELLNARFERACTLLLVADRADEGRADLAALGLPLPACG